MLHVFVGCGCLVLLGGLGCSFVHVFVFVVVVGSVLLFLLLAYSPRVCAGV